METNNVTRSGIEIDGDAGLGPASIRRIGAALAAGDSERAWTLIDRAGVRDPHLVGRALTARGKAAFLGRLLKALPVSQRTKLHEVVASLMEGRQPSLAPATTFPGTVTSA